MELIKSSVEQARKASVSLQLMPMPELTQIVADKRRLKQALFAFLSFAVSAAREQTALTLSVKIEQRRKVLALSITCVSKESMPQNAFNERFETLFAKNLTEMHGGKAEAVFKDDRLIIDIKLPVK